MFWVVQSIGLLTIILTIISFLQKEKWKMMACLLATNITLMVSYYLVGNTLGMLLVLGALVRTIVYFYYNHHNKKPETLIMFLFEIYYVVIAVLNWTSVVDLLMVINLVVVTYTSWQTDVKLLRFGYIFSSLLLIPYDLYYGLYTVALSEVIMLIITLISLVKYAKITKTSYKVAQKYFTANKQFWGSKVIENQDYDLIDSSLVDKSPFYNFGIIKNNKKPFETIASIKEEMKQKGVKEVAYIPFDSKKYNEATSLAYTLQMFFPVEYQDVWMKLIDGFNLNNTKCKIQNVVHKEVDETKVEDIIQVYIKGYHSKADVNDLSQNEKSQVENLRRVDFNNKAENGFKTYAYVSYFNNVPIAMLVFLSDGREGYITKVSTIPAFRRKHVASSLMQYAIGEQRKKGVQEIILVTDKYSSNEKFYEFNNFVEFGQAFAFNVENTEKYENFLKNNVV